MRTLFVGDVHGCFEELLELLSKANYKKEDRLIFLGDLINKGPYSLDVLKWVKKEKAESILGNHELAFLNYLEKPNDKYQGFKKLAEEMGESVELWRDWLSKLPLFIEEDDFIAVHGGLVPGVPLDELDPSIITRIRTWDGVGVNLNNEKDPPWYELYEGSKLVIYGHWAADGLKIREKTKGIDSGCCWGGKLSLYSLEEDQVFQVKAKKAYSKVL